MSRFAAAAAAVANALDLSRETVLLAREAVMLMREGVHVVRERKTAENVALRARVDELESRLKACEDDFRSFRRAAREATS